MSFKIVTYIFFYRLELDLVCKVGSLLPIQKRQFVDDK